MKVQVFLVLALVAAVQSVEMSRRRKGVHHKKMTKSVQKQSTKGGNTVEIEKTRVEIKSAQPAKVNQPHDKKAPFQLSVVSKNKSLAVEDALQIELNKRFMKIKSSIQRQKIKTLLEQLQFSQQQIEKNMKVKAALAEAQYKLALKNQRLEKKIVRLQKIKARREKRRHH